MSEQPMTTELTTNEIVQSNLHYEQIVSDLQLTPEAIQDPTNVAFLNLVSEVWAATEDMPLAEAADEREWLTETTLRGVGWQSEYVKDHELSEFQIDEAEVSAYKQLVDQFGQSEQSRTLAQNVSTIATKFGFNKKFSTDHVINGDVACVVVPDNAPEELMRYFKGAGATIEVTGFGQKIIAIREFNYQRAFIEGSEASEGLIAHELGHTQQDVRIGKGEAPLGILFDEIAAERASDFKTMYYDEKHMINLLQTTGFNFVGDILPKMAHGDLSKADFINVLRENFGSKNALRLLAYAPDNYRHIKSEAPAQILQSCIMYKKSNGLEDDAIRTKIDSLYTPEVAEIVLNTKPIRRIVPDTLYPMILQRAHDNKVLDNKEAA